MKRNEWYRNPDEPGMCQHEFTAMICLDMSRWLSLDDDIVERLDALWLSICQFQTTRIITVGKFHQLCSCRNVVGTSGVLTLMGCLMETSTGLQCFNLLFPALSGHKGRLKHGSACKKGKGNEHCTGGGTTMMGISTMQIVRSLSRFLEVNPQVLSFNYNMFFLHATHCYALPCSYVWQLKSQRGKYCLHWRPQDTPTIRSFSSDNFDIANVHKCSYFTCLLFLQEMAGKMVDAAAGHAQPCCQNTLASESHQTSSPSTSLHWELRRVLLYGIDSMLL